MSVDGENEESVGVQYMRAYACGRAGVGGQWQEKPRQRHVCLVARMISSRVCGSHSAVPAIPGKIGDAGVKLRWDESGCSSVVVGAQL